jgi:hypothetical protein
MVDTIRKVHPYTAYAVIWDGASIHHILMIKDFLAKGGTKRIRIEHFPAYAPELNP